MALDWLMVAMVLRDQFIQVAQFKRDDAKLIAQGSRSEKFSDSPLMNDALGGLL